MDYYYVDMLGELKKDYPSGVALIPHGDHYKVVDTYNNVLNIITTDEYSYLKDTQQSKAGGNIVFNYTGNDERVARLKEDE